MARISQNSEALIKSVLFATYIIVLHILALAGAATIVHNLLDLPLFE